MKKDDKDSRNPFLPEIDEIKNPFPNSSLGDIGRVVRITLAPGPDFRFSPPVTVPFKPTDLGWVDPASLRLFLIDQVTGEYRLVSSSSVNLETSTVHAVIDQSGIYAVIGLPVAGPVREVVEEMNALSGRWVGVGLGKGWHAPICERILCAGPPWDRRPPKGITGDPCEICLGLPSQLVPEIQLLPDRPIRNITQWIPSAPPKLPRTGPLLYALIDFANRNQFVEIVDTTTWKKVGLLSLPLGNGEFYASDFAVSGNYLAVLDRANTNVVLVTAAGVTRTVGVGSGPNHCAFSLDGSTLYVTRNYGIDAIDTVTGTVTQIFPAMPIPSNTYQFSCVRVSPDGKTVVARSSNYPTVVLFDTASLTTRLVAAPLYGLLGGGLMEFATNTQIVLFTWDLNNVCQIRQIDVTAGVILPGVIDVDSPFNPPNSVVANVTNGGTTALVSRSWPYVFPDISSDVVEVDIAASTYVIRGTFAGYSTASVLNPHPNNTFYIGVAEGGGISPSLATYDVNSQVLSQHVYTFLNGVSMPLNYTCRVSALAMGP